MVEKLLKKKQELAKELAGSMAKDEYSPDSKGNLRTMPLQKDCSVLEGDSGEK